MTAFWCHSPRDFVSVRGADALTYLHSQISQDIRNLAIAESAYSFVLQPVGKIEALMRVARMSDDEFVLDTDPGFGDELIARLNRFKIRVKVEIAPLDWTCIAVRSAPDRPAQAIGAWGLSDAFDLCGQQPAPPPGVAEGSSADLELQRILAGWPAMGSEITDASIPAETGVTDLAVNFTKGCYPGQELVERMDSRGSAAPRFVRLLRNVQAAQLGDELTHDAKSVGHITSVALGAALAVVARSVKPGDSVMIDDKPVLVEESRPLQS